MRRFWDRRAEEDPFFFVDSRMEYGKPDLERFWADGERDLDKLLAALGVTVQPQDRILEIGCGVGRLTRVLASRGASVSALDVSQRMLDKAAELNPGLSNVKWILGDGSSPGSNCGEQRRCLRFTRRLPAHTRSCGHARLRS